MVTSPEYRHVPTGTLAVLAQRLGTGSTVLADLISGAAAARRARREANRSASCHSCRSTDVAA